MARPELSHEERQVINSALVVDFDWRALAYLLVSLIMFSYGIFTANVPLIISAFGLVFYMRAYELVETRRWNTIWKAAIEKYEEALAKADDSEPKLQS